MPGARSRILERGAMRKTEFDLVLLSKKLNCCVDGMRLAFADPGIAGCWYRAVPVAHSRELPADGHRSGPVRGRDPRSVGAATGFRAIELAGNKLAVPGQDSIRPRHS